MKTTVNFYQFRDAFLSVRPNNFSIEGLATLFDYLEQFEEETGEEMELDVIAICCDFSEDTIENTLNDYGYESLDELQGNTTVLYVDDLENWKTYEPELDRNKRVIIQRF